MKNLPISALACADNILSGTIGKTKAFDEFVSAITDHEPSVRAFTHLDVDGCRKMIAQSKGPLAGLPIGIKDIIDTYDMPTECGSPIYKGRMPSSDAPVVSMVRRAGGSVIGKTVTTEFAASFAGSTTNPHDSSRTPGGSSSGSAAAVAAGMVPLAIGSQTAGSVIRPASFCGVAGYKPSFGVLPTANVKLFSWSLDTLGLFGAGVRDVAFFAQAITGRRLSVVDLDDWRPRIGLAPSTAWKSADVEMVQAIQTAATAASSLGASVTALSPHHLYDDAQWAQEVIQNFEFVRALAFEQDRFKDMLSAPLRHALQLAQETPAELYELAQQIAKRARSEMLALFTEVDVLLAPSANGPAPEGLISTGDPLMCRVWTLLGYPCVNVPGLKDSRGLPLGVQIIAPFGDDAMALRAAAWLEDALRGPSAVC